ncbi:MAG TPA: hypothetical protein VNF51_00490 [Candidatus Paceibacterota bacterium]|nr:hypothetical protein [Candidatus Paceibacterota bacterium]
MSKIISLLAYKSRRNRPIGHPPLRRGPRGKALLDVNQVWVESRTNTLWVIVSLKDDELQDGTHTHRVWLRPYDASERFRNKRKRELIEPLLRILMRVWEDAVQIDPALKEKLNNIETGPTPPEAA